MIKPQAFYNSTDETIPAFSVVQVDPEADAYSNEGRDFFVVSKPDGNPSASILVSGGVPVGSDDGRRVGYGVVPFEGAWVAYSGTAPDIGGEVGPVEDEWTVTTSGSGLFAWLVDESNSRVYAYANTGHDRTIICTPQKDVDTGEPMVCDILEGPIGLETGTGETLIGINMGGTILANTRCEAVHYSYRKGGEPHPLTGPEVSSLLSCDEDALSSTTTTQYANYELFSLEC